MLHNSVHYLKVYCVSLVQDSVMILIFSKLTSDPFTG